jgi:elongator complex protein 5
VVGFNPALDSTRPYLLHEDQKAARLQITSQQSSKIVYEPDDADDIDEEDPDDDLDI